MHLKGVQQKLHVNFKRTRTDALKGKHIAENSIFIFVWDQVSVVSFIFFSFVPDLF